MSTRSIFPGITIPKISIPKISIPRTTIPRSQFPGPQFQESQFSDHNLPGYIIRLHPAHPVTFSYIRLHPSCIRLHPAYPVTSSHIRLHPVISPLCLNYLAGHVWIVCDDGVHMSSLTHLYILRSINGPHIQGKALSLRLLDESRELQVI